MELADLDPPLLIRKQTCTVERFGPEADEPLIGSKCPSVLQTVRFRRGGTMWPRRPAMISITRPTDVQISNATTLASIPNLPPVRSSGPSIVALTNLVVQSHLTTEPEKMPFWVKFQAM